MLTDLTTGSAVDLVGNLGALGIVFWLVRRTFSHTIPRLSGDFTKAIKEARDDFRAILRDQREDYHNAINVQQKFFADQIAQERAQTTEVIDVFRTTRRTG